MDRWEGRASWSEVSRAVGSLWAVEGTRRLDTALGGVQVCCRTPSYASLRAECPFLSVSKAYEESLELIRP